MVDISPYTASDYRTLQALLMSQDYKGFDDITAESLPKIGFMASIDGTPVAVGFLRRLEGGYAQLDTLVSNGNLSSELRHEGVSALVDSLIQAAKDLKLKGIVAHTQDQGVLKRALSLGFRVVQQAIIALPL